MKVLTTKKAMRESAAAQGVTLLAVGFCHLQSLLAFREPVAYSTRREGWACDYYKLTDTVWVSTGYSPIGLHVDYDLLAEYDGKALAVRGKGLDYAEEREAVEKLIAEFVSKVSGR